MGLDMYLYANKLVSRKDYSRKKANEIYDFEDNEAFAAIVSILNAESLIDNEWSGLTVSLPVGYWRKANQIHGWIVKNCADGIDECQRIYVSRDKAMELVGLCKSVLSASNLANELLPPVAGFFFGDSEVDEWYLNDLQRTIDIFEKVLSSDDVDGITYQASW